jgi:hypothetical protein
LVTGEGGGSLEGGFHGGVAWPEGNGGEGRRLVVEVGGSRFGKVVRTRAVVGVVLTERVGGWSRSWRELLHCNHVQRDKGARAVHVAIICGHARATGAWLNSYCVHARLATGRHLSGA